MARMTDMHRQGRASSKVELYTRYSFYGSGGLVFVLNLPGLIAERMFWAPLPLLLQSVLCTVLCVRAMEWRLDRRPRPVRLAVAVGVVSAVEILGLLALFRNYESARLGVFAALLMMLCGFGVSALVVALRTTAHRVGVVLGVPVLTAVATVLLGAGWRQAGANFVAVMLMSGLFSVASVFSIWLVRIVWELDEAHELRARLAVAEERLRFGRDLHDVLGRNLAVIALKSELAVQLAERGRPQAVDQMTEVQRIARESQREVREVVRGYREANLHTELEGARGVLEAAGIDCRIHGVETIEGRIPGGLPRTGGGAGLPAEVQSALGWVVREATTNVLRHGDPRRCTVRLSEEPYAKGEATGDGTGNGAGDVAGDGAGDVPEVRGAGVDVPGRAGGDEGWEAVLTVENDGVPEAGPAENARKGSGLAGLRERLAAVGGTLEAARTEQGDGFRLTARIPLPAPGTAPGRRPRGGGRLAGAGAGAWSGAGERPGRGGPLGDGAGAAWDDSGERSGSGTGTGAGVPA
ncbi:histidine kinase [Streptomyces sp. NPDC093085]|uniref:sensor histidine kinase n=1 Tax=Streptomyces sp. NPDC093085 TaxID=3155068 RepID=UPI00342D962B